MKKYAITIAAIVKNNLSWLLVSAVVFLFCLLWFYNQAGDMTAETNNLIGDQLEDTLHGILTIIEEKPLLGATLILANNLLTMIQMLILGVILGLSPILTLVINGATVGLVLSIATSEGMSLPAIIFLGLLPHGLFELFAFFLCSAFGLKLGYHCTLFPLTGKTRKESFFHIWREILAVLPLVFFLLLLAALVEVFITPALLATVL